MALTTGPVHTYQSNTFSQAEIVAAPDGRFFAAYRLDNANVAVDVYNPVTQSWDNYAAFSAAQTGAGNRNVPEEIDLVVTSDGRLHIAFQFDQNDGFPFDDLRGIGYGVYDGTSWSFSVVDQNFDSSGSGFKAFDTQSLKIDANGKAHVAYQYRDGSSADTHIKYATNASGSFVSDFRASYTSDTNPGINEVKQPFINVGLDGTLYMTYLREDNINSGNGNLYLQSKPPGGPWSAEVLLDGTYGVANPHLLTETAIDAAGKLHIFYVSGGAVYDLNNVSGSFATTLAIPATESVASVRGYQEVNGVEYLLVTDTSQDTDLFSRNDGGAWQENIQAARGGSDTDLAINVQGQMMLILSAALAQRQITFATDQVMVAAPPNAAPTAITLGPATVAENTANGTLVGTLSVIDPDGPSASYALLDNAGGRFQLLGNQILVADGLLLDFEQNASHTVRVAVDDGAGGLYQQDILITLGNVTPESVVGDGRGNVIVAGTGNDMLYGKGGDDDLTGGGGIDLLDGGTGADTLRGGAGDDVYGIDDIGDTIDEAAGAGSGLDTIKALIDIDLADYANVENVKLFGSGTIAATGSGAANVLDGSLNAAANTLTGLGGDDVYVIGANDIIVEADGGGFDTVKATAASADISGFDFVEGVKLAGALAIDATGNGGANTLIGNGAANTLSGLGGNDILSGGAGEDILIGGAGLDKLSGGADNDTFRFVEAADSPFAGADKIFDFAAGDAIDVSGIDADGDAGNGDQAFVLDALGDTSFAAGHVRQTVAKSGNALYLDFNTDADSAAEMRIVVVGRTTALSASDFDL